MRHSKNIKLYGRGLWTLARPLPVAAWAISGTLVGAGAAAGAGAVINLLWLTLLLTAGILLQGMAAHAYNDREDWRSGTDPASPGLLSGGSGVIRHNLLNLDQLTLVGTLSVIAVTSIGIYFYLVRGPLILVFLITGIWSAVSYSCPPLRLAYRPGAGEWLAAFPGVVACTAGSAYVLAGSITPVAWLAAVIHGLFSLGWLMHHHIPDIEADLSACPPKITTISLIGSHFGADATRWVTASMFYLAMVSGLAASFIGYPIFVVSAVMALPCIWLALGTDCLDIRDVSTRELGMAGVSIIHATVLAYMLSGFKG